MLETAPVHCDREHVSKKKYTREGGWRETQIKHEGKIKKRGDCLRLHSRAGKGCPTPLLSFVWPENHSKQTEKHINHSASSPQCQTSGLKQPCQVIHMHTRSCY